MDCFVKVSRFLDEDSIRLPGGSLIQQRNAPETALAQQSAVVALLTASHQMSANRCV